MSHALDQPCRHNYISNKLENEIRQIFYQHWEEMKNQMEATMSEIQSWRFQCIREIEICADEQVRILKNDYDRQRRIFDEKRKENLETAKAFHYSKQTELFNELRHECHLLKFGVARLVFVQKQIKRPRVITVVEQTNDIHESDSENSRTRLIEEHSNTTAAEKNSDVERSSSSRTPLIPARTHQEALVASSVNGNDPLADVETNSKVFVTNNDEFNSKCPICFMIFPLNMRLDDRYHHINEHMTDDQQEY